jgi:hypothetical protein
MGSTPNSVIPYIDPTDALSNYPVSDKAQADRLDALLSFSLPWTAWPSAVTGTTKYRVVNGIFFVQVDGSFTSVSGTQYTLSTTPLPVNLRPANHARAGCFFSGAYVGLLTVEASTGNLVAQQQTGSNRTSISGLISYALG